MSKVGDMKKILKDMESEVGLEVGVVITRNGIPMAWNSSDAATDIETFATLSATIFGASEVIFSGIKKPSPDIVMVHSPEGLFIASGLGKKGVLAGITKSTDTETIKTRMLAASDKIKGVL